MQNIGVKVKEARKRKKLTQNDLANKIGVTKHAIAKYEQGQREPNLEILTKIIDELEIDLWELSPNLNMEIKAAEPYEEGIKFAKEVSQKKEYKETLDKWAGDKADYNILKENFSLDKLYSVHQKLRGVEYEEYVKRIQKNNNIDDVVMDTKTFREDFYKEVNKTLEFVIKLKLEEAKEKIKEY